MKPFFAKLGDKLKVFGREAYLFLTSLIFLKNFLGIIASLALLTFLSLWWMKCYTYHGESLQVHDYIGMDLKDAIRKAKDRSFSVVVNDSIYVVGERANVVREQHPLPFSRVKQNRTIYLTVTKFYADEKLLPTLKGNYDYNIYSRKLANRHIKTVIKERVFDNNQAKNTILYMYYNGKKITEDDIENGIKIPMGSTLEVVVTDRGGTSVQMPNLVCMKFSEAKFLIENYQLNVGSIVPDQTITDESTAYVWKQTPGYNARQYMRMGEFIDLYITQYRPDDCSNNL